MNNRKCIEEDNVSEKFLNMLIDKASEKNREELRSSFRQHDLKKDEYAFLQEDSAADLFLIEEGIMEAHMLTPDGKFNIINFLYPGDLFGEGTVYENSRYPYSAMARERVMLWRAPKKEIKTIMSKDMEFTAYLLAIVGKRLDECYFKIRCISGEKVQKRILCVLLKAVDERGISNGCGLLLDVPLTNRDLAGLVGTTEESVSRFMSSLKRDGIIAVEEKRLVICDKKALVEMFENSD